MPASVQRATAALVPYSMSSGWATTHRTLSTPSSSRAAAPTRSCRQPGRAAVSRMRDDARPPRSSPGIDEVDERPATHAGGSRGMRAHARHPALTPRPGATGGVARRRGDERRVRRPRLPAARAVLHRGGPVDLQPGGPPGRGRSDPLQRDQGADYPIFGDHLHPVVLALGLPWRLWGDPERCSSRRRSASGSPSRSSAGSRSSGWAGASGCS